MADELIAGRYRLIEPLGRGAMSSVWLASDEELGRQVAVKTLAPTADRTRFEREARAAASLSHPNLCNLYDYGEADGRPYMVLEHLPGGTLEERLRAKAPLPDDETGLIAGEIAAGLAHAHERGLVHRDLKPANVLFDGEGRAKIADFGIARMGDAGTLTEAGTVLGTAAYISPEQASGHPAGPASDVYSFGAILFRMLTGALPFTSANAMELVRMHRDDPPPTVASLRPDAPPLLAALADASLAKDPAARPADGAALQRALADVGGEATMLLAPVAGAAATDETQVLRPVRAERRRRGAPAALALVVALLLVGGAAAAWLATRSSSSPPPHVSPLSLPDVQAGKTTTTAAATQAATTAAVVPPPTTTGQTTAPTTTAATTTAPTTTRRETTIPATTATLPVTTFPTTVAPPTTTFAPPPPTTTPTTTAAATTTAATTTTGP